MTKIGEKPERKKERNKKNAIALSIGTCLVMGIVAFEIGRSDVGKPQTEINNQHLITLPERNDLFLERDLASLESKIFEMKRLLFVRDNALEGTKVKTIRDKLQEKSHIVSELEKKQETLLQSLNEQKDKTNEVEKTMIALLDSIDLHKETKEKGQEKLYSQLDNLRHEHSQEKDVLVRKLELFEKTAAELELALRDKEHEVALAQNEIAFLSQNLAASSDLYEYNAHHLQKSERENESLAKSLKETSDRLAKQDSDVDELINVYENERKELAIEFIHLESLLDSEKHANEIKEAKLAAAEEKVKGLENNLSELLAKSEIHEKELYERIQTAEESVNQKDKDLNDLALKLKDYTFENLALNSALEEIAHINQEIKTEKTQLAVALGSLQDNYIELKSSTKALGLENLAVLEETGKKGAELEEHVLITKTQFAALSEDYEKLAFNYHQEATENKELIEKKSYEIERLSEELSRIETALRDEKEQSQLEIAKYEDTEKTLKDAREELEQITASFNAQLQEKIGEHETVLNTLAALQTEVQNKNDTLKELTDHIEKLTLETEKGADYLAKNESLESQIANKNKQHEDILLRIEQINEQYAAVLEDIQLKDEKLAKNEELKSLLAELEEQLANKNQQHKELVQKIDEVNQEYAARTTAKESENESLKKHLAELEEQLAQKKQEHEEFLVRVEQINEQYASAQEDMHEHDGKLAESLEIKKLLESTKEHLASLEEQKNLLESRLEEELAAKDRLSEKERELEERIAAKNDQYEDLVKQIEKMSEQTAFVEETIKFRDERIAESEKLNEELSKLVAELQEEKAAAADQLSQKLKELAETLALSQNERDSLTQEKEILNSKLAEEESFKKSLIGKEKDLEEKLDKLLSEYALSQEKLALIEKEMTLDKNELESLHEKLAEQTTLKEHLEEYQANFNKAEEELKEKTQEISYKDQKLAELVKEIEQLNEHTYTVKNSLLQVQDENKESREKIQQLTDLLLNHQTEIESEKQEISRLVEHSSTINETLYSIEEEKKNLIFKIEELTAKLKEKEENLFHKESRIAETQYAIEQLSLQAEKDRLSEIKIQELTKQLEEKDSEIQLLTEEKKSFELKLSELQLSQDDSFESDEEEKG